MRQFFSDCWAIAALTPFVCVGALPLRPDSLDIRSTQTQPCRDTVKTQLCGVERLRAFGGLHLFVKMSRGNKLRMSCRRHPTGLAQVLLSFC